MTESTEHQAPEPEDRTDTRPHVCEGCGAIDSLGVYHNTENDELSVDCTKCGLEYDPDKDGREQARMDAMFGLRE